MSKQCGKDGCSDVAKWWPILLLYAPATFQDSPPMKVQLPIPICDECKQAAKLADFMGVEGFARLADRIIQAAKVRPDPSRSRLDFCEIEEHE